MSCACSPRVRPWREEGKRTEGRERGTATLMVLFLLFVFSGLGLGMVYFSEVHLKLNANRKFSLFLDYATENGLKRGLGDLCGWLESAGPAVPVAESRVEAFRAEPGTAFPLLLEEALGGGFPRLLRESDGGLSWECLSTCGLRSLEDQGDYFRITGGLVLESTGAWRTLRPRRVSRLEASLGVLAGRLPLPAIPFLIGKDMPDAERSRFLEENAVSFASRVCRDTILWEASSRWRSSSERARARAA